MTVYQLDDLITMICGDPCAINTAIAREFARAGATIVLAGRDHPDLHAVAEEITLEGGNAIAIATNLARHEEVADLIAQTVTRHGRLDVMVNHPAIVGNTDGEIHVIATLHCCMAAGREMRKRSSGTIINISLPAVGRSDPTWPYAEDLIQLSKDLARQWWSDGISVNCISPGHLSTAWRRQPKAAADWRRVLRTGYTPGPQDVAAATRFLASPAASPITGETIQLRNWFSVDRFEELSPATQSTQVRS